MADEQFNTSSKSYKLSQMLIGSSTGDPKRDIDITNLMIELSIFEDMFNSTIAGQVLVSDSLDLIARIPLIGFEYLRIKLSKPGTESKITKVFRIYKIDKVDVSFGSQSNQTYTIRFCSEEQILSATRRVSKSYKGKTASEIIDDIVRNQLKVPDSRIAKFEKSTGKHDMIIPFGHPLAAIQFVVSRTKPPFMFYESNRGFVLASLHTLFKQKSVMKYRFTPQNIDAVKGVNSVIKYEFLEVFDEFRAITNGMFSSNLITIDPIRQKVSDIIYDYGTEFDKNPHIETNGFPFHNKPKNRFGKTPNENKHSMVRFYPTTKDHDTNENISKKQPGLNPNQVEQWMLQRASMMQQLDYFKLKMVVPGTTEVAIGDIIEFGVPLLTIKDRGGENNNPYTSGRFLVTAIRHKINFTSYEMIIEAVRDSFAKALPAAGNQKMSAE